MTHSYERIGSAIPLAMVLPFTTPRHSSKSSKKIQVNNLTVNVSSNRLNCFGKKGVVCAFCGIVGYKFHTETAGNQKTFHLNLYARDNDGNEVLMTHDHILPRSKGGGNALDNLQTACGPCNWAKGNSLEYKVSRYDVATEPTWPYTRFSERITVGSSPTCLNFLDKCWKWDTEPV